MKQSPRFLIVALLTLGSAVGADTDVKLAGPATPETLVAMNRLNDAKRVEGHDAKGIGTARRVFHLLLN